MTPFARELARLRSLHGYSLRTLARRAWCSGQLISYLEHGERRPSARTAELLDEALDAGGTLAALAADSAPAVDLPLWTPAMTPEPGAPLGEDDIAGIRATVTHLVGLDTALGSDGLMDVAARAFRTASDRLAAHGTRGDPADMRSAVADLGIAASWIAADAVQHQAARQIGMEALLLAELAGDDHLRRFLLSHLSMLGEHAGRGTEALAFAERALAEELPVRVRAMFSVRKARALGKLGAGDEAVAAWEHARHLLEVGPDDSAGLTYWLHDAEMAVHRAVILADTGRAAEAIEWGQRSIDMLPAAQGRDAVLFRAMLLHDAARAQAWPEVEAAAAELLAAPAARSARVPASLRAALACCGRAPARTRDAVRAALAALS